MALLQAIPETDPNRMMENCQNELCDPVQLPLNIFFHKKHPR